MLDDLDAQANGNGAAAHVGDTGALSADATLTDLFEGVPAPAADALQAAAPADDDQYTILVPTTDLGAAGRLIQVAAALMPVHEGEARGKVLPLGVVEIPEDPVQAGITA